MGKSLIGRLPVEWSPTDGWSIDKGDRFLLDQIEADLRQISGGRPVRLTLSVAPYRRRRSDQQNRMMWALLTIMASAYNGGRTGGVTAEDCYLEMLERYGARVDYLEAPVAALPILRENYRVVHVVELLDDNRCTVKCSAGSSSFTTDQMAQLIDGIFDRLAEMGVNDAEVTGYWREWRAEELPARQKGADAG